MPSVVGGRTFDWVPRFDPKNRNYPVRALVPTQQPRSYTWACDTWLDQKNEGACVAFGHLHEAAAKPKVVPGLTDQDGFDFYSRLKQIDEYPGTDYEGTSVNAGGKGMVERGYWKAYHWAETVDDIILGVGRHGPCVMGSVWTEDMWDVDANGFVHATGNEVGGHCTLIRGVNLKAQYVRGRNSWGKPWGKDGDFLLSFADLQTLLDRSGEFSFGVRV